MSSPVASRVRRLVGSAPATPNQFGLGVAITGLVTGWLIATIALNLWPGSSGPRTSPSLFRQDLINLTGLWIGLVLASVGARPLSLARDTGRSRTNRVTPGDAIRDGRLGVFAQMRVDYGIAIRPVDLAIGIAAGLAGQYLITPLLELPLVPFVPNLFTRLNDPANSWTHNITGSRFLILGVFVCLGSPAVEELYFRGLVLRALLGRCVGARFTRSRASLAVVVPIVLDGIFFGLVHFEPLELLALSGFGIVLAWLAWSTGRLGPGFVAHVTFNSATFIALARTH